LFRAAAPTQWGGASVKLRACSRKAGTFDGKIKISRGRMCVSGVLLLFAFCFLLSPTTATS
jgi:hypothetical protein